MIGGSFGLREFAQLRYQFRKTKTLDPKDVDFPMKPSSEITIESVYEEIKDLDLDDWENIRGPRPHEPGSEEAIAQMKQKAAARRKQLEEAKMNRIRNTQ